MLVAHGGPTIAPAGYVSAGFTPPFFVIPYDVRLGYTSPDNFGKCIWWFCIECSVLKDGSYTYWAQILTGLHQMLGFGGDAVIAVGDLDQLAMRLTGTGGYPRQTIWHSFYDTFRVNDGIHNNNLPRTLVEEASVYYDYINSYNSTITVTGSKYLYTAR